MAEPTPRADTAAAAATATQQTNAPAHVPTAASPSAVLQLSYEGAAASSAASTAASSTPSDPHSLPSSLTPAAVAAFDATLAAQGERGVRDFFLLKYEKDAVRNWDVFYKRNADRFYKDRHYLTAEFPELGQLLARTRRERGEEPAGAAQQEEDDGGDEGLPSASPPAAASPVAPLLPIQLPTVFASASQPRLLEVGCGVGNAFFPLLKLMPDLFVYALDCSKNAIQVVQNHAQYRQQFQNAATAAAATAAATAGDDAANNSAADAAAAACSSSVVSAASPPPVARCAAWVCDLVTDDFPSVLRSDSDGHVDFATLVFVLSAIHPERMEAVLRKVCQTLKAHSGVLFLRDYCHYDLAQLRFAPSSKLGPQWYVRQDGTRSYFFHLHEISALLERSGFEVIEAQVVCKVVRNRKEHSEMNRRFVQLRARRRRTEAPQTEAEATEGAAAESSEAAAAAVPVAAAASSSASSSLASAV